MVERMCCDRLEEIGVKSLPDSLTHSSLLRAELEEVLRTVPPLTTRRHETPENLAWLGRAANIIERWEPARAGAFAQLNRQFQSRNAHEANEAFRQMMVLLQQAQHDLRIRARAATLEGHLRQLRAQDEILQKAGKQQIPLPVSTLLLGLFREIGEGLAELNLSPFKVHGQATVLRSQVSAAIQKLSDYLPGDSAPAGSPQSAAAPANPELVFVIHGRQLQEEFHAFLRALGLRPLEWADARRRTGKTNPYTWEIVDGALSEAGAIVALLTPDDEARLAKHLWAEHENALEKERLLQPRQNVLFEAGVAYGRAPERTVLIRVGSHRPMSDLAGHHILQLDDSPQSRQSVADALRAAGCPVDLSGTDWFRAGRLSTTPGQSAAERAATSENSQASDSSDDSRALASRLLFE